MDEHTPKAKPNGLLRPKGPPLGLRIEPPAHDPSIAMAVGDTSALSSATSGSASPPSSTNSKPKFGSTRNVKRLSLVLPSAHSNSSSNSLVIPKSEEPQFQTATSTNRRPRQASVVSLPAPSMSAMLYRKDEDGSPSAPYTDGPVEVMPGVWLGSEDNARDWQGLITRGIKSILNVAKEVNSPFDSLATTQTLRPFASTPNLKQKFDKTKDTYYPAHGASGRPAMHYLKLAWSHGQSNLVKEGFASAMSFVDASLGRGDGVLIHCQCGVSRSATLVIALVMRAASLQSPSLPDEILALKNGGMQGAYSFVKTKSQWVGPNMSLIYQLLDYERALKGKPSSPDTTSSFNEEDEEQWSRQRMAQDSPPYDESDRESTAIMSEAAALDKAMEDRLVARKADTASLSSLGSIRKGSGWKNHYTGRQRTGSVRSVFTNSSVITENLLDEDERSDLSGMEDVSDGLSLHTTSPGTDVSEDEVMTNAKPIVHLNRPVKHMLSPIPGSPQTARPEFTPRQTSMHSLSSTIGQCPPSAPASKFSFSIPRKFKRRPPPLGFGLSPVPSSPIAPVAPSLRDQRPIMASHTSAPQLSSLRDSSRTFSYSKPTVSLHAPTPTLFVFPPDPTGGSRTPSTMTVMANLIPSISFPSPQTPRISTVKLNGRSKSFIGIRTPITPSVASSRVDAYGWIGHAAAP